MGLIRQRCGCDQHYCNGSTPNKYTDKDARRANEYPNTHTDAYEYRYADSHSHCYRYYGSVADTNQNTYSLKYTLADRYADIEWVRLDLCRWFRVG